MVNSHYCVTHDTPFFKKGKMKGYAHPIGDTGEWCNEEEAEAPPKPPPSTASPSNDKDRAIARAVALKAAVESEGYRLKTGGEPLSTKGILGVAEIFEGWLTR